MFIKNTLVKNISNMDNFLGQKLLSPQVGSFCPVLMVDPLKALKKLYLDFSFLVITQVWETLNGGNILQIGLRMSKIFASEILVRILIKAKGLIFKSTFGTMCIRSFPKLALKIFFAPLKPI